MYAAAIQALHDNRPEQAIRLIVKSMRAVQKSSEHFELEVLDAIHDLTKTPNFLLFDEWRIS